MRQLPVREKIISGKHPLGKLIIVEQNIGSCSIAVINTRCFLLQDVIVSRVVVTCAKARLVLVLFALDKELLR